MNRSRYLSFQVVLRMLWCRGSIGRPQGVWFMRLVDPEDAVEAADSTAGLRWTGFCLGRMVVTLGVGRTR